MLILIQTLWIASELESFMRRIFLLSQWCISKFFFSIVFRDIPQIAITPSSKLNVTCLRYMFGDHQKHAKLKNLQKLLLPHETDVLQLQWGTYEDLLSFSYMPTDSKLREIERDPFGEKLYGPRLQVRGQLWRPCVFSVSSDHLFFLKKNIIISRDLLPARLQKHLLYRCIPSTLLQSSSSE